MELLAAKDAKLKEKKEKGDIIRTVKERERKEIKMKEVKDKKVYIYILLILWWYLMSNFFLDV